MGPPWSQDQPQRRKPQTSENMHLTNLLLKSLAPSTWDPGQPMPEPLMPMDLRTGDLLCHLRPGHPALTVQFPRPAPGAPAPRLHTLEF